ncbi:hypothetical protein BPAE_0115g00110 [Botrytis paeoniae]|uniref:Uncharacterized protein n=1 Tax=Botrytis paeoniae TaxID=278948 RepID=A0A4Z1FMD6_9HELO|nr:hypothetical protein BPAE_0115g00110 [Botrytis paeoniae]
MKSEKLVTQGKRNADLDAEEKMANSIRLDNTVAVAIYGFVDDDILEETCQVKLSLRIIDCQAILCLFFSEALRSKPESFNAEGPWRFLNVTKVVITTTLEFFSSLLVTG